MFIQSLLLSALASCVAAQSKVLFFTHVPNPVTDGSKQAITYSTNDTQTPVTIILRKGQTDNLQTVKTLTTDSVGGQYIWTPPPSLPDGEDYALEIKQGSQINYYGPFIVQGAQPASVSAASMSSSNSTMTGTAASLGTGTTMHRNTTMSHPHHKHKTTKHPITHHTTKAPKSTSGASFQGSPTGKQTSSTGAASSSDVTTNGFLALLFGALAAMV